MESGKDDSSSEALLQSSELEEAIILDPELYIFVKIF
jgi:hypothetical protein